MTNRDTQKVEKITYEEDGSNAELTISEIKEITLPKEAETATESTEEDIMMSLFAVLLSGVDTSDMESSIATKDESTITSEVETITSTESTTSSK